MTEIPEEPSPELPVPKGTPLFRVRQDDLATLEEIIPWLMWRNLESCNDTKTRMKWRQVKDILSNIRWGDGPPSEVHRIDAGE